MVLLAAVLLARDVRLRAIALVALVPVLARALPHVQPGAVHRACTSSWSSSPGGSGAGLGIAVLVVGLVVGRARCCRRYLQLRGSSVSEGAVSPGSILVASDELPVPGLGRGGPRCGATSRSSGRATWPTRSSPRPSATRSWARRTTSGCGSSPRRASIVGLVGLAFLVATAGRSGARPRLAGDRDPGRLPRLRHRGVVQQPVAVRPGHRPSPSRSSASGWRWRSVPVRRRRPTADGDRCPTGTASPIAARAGRVRRPPALH